MNYILYVLVGLLIAMAVLCAIGSFLCVVGMAIRVEKAIKKKERSLTPTVMALAYCGMLLCLFAVLAAEIADVLISKML